MSCSSFKLLSEQLPSCHGQLCLHAVPICNDIKLTAEHAHMLWPIFDGLLSPAIPACMGRGCYLTATGGGVCRCKFAGVCRWLASSWLAKQVHCTTSSLAELQSSVPRLACQFPKSMAKVAGAQNGKSNLEKSGRHGCSCTDALVTGPFMPSLASEQTFIPQMLALTLE